MALAENKSTNPVCDAANLHATSAVGATPAMAQYLEQKAAHPDCLLFYRMGDFYELFFEDAVIAAQILDIALTKRGKHGGQDITMCGVPFHAADAYLNKLIASGHKVAICEQMETPEEAKKRGYKAVVRREVVRIVTPGTITEEALLSPSETHYLCALLLPDSVHGLGSIGWLDMSTGTFLLTEVRTDSVSAVLARIQPREILIGESSLAAARDAIWRKEYQARFTIKPDASFDARKGEHSLRQEFQVQSSDSFGALSDADVAVCGALIDYVRLTQMQSAVRLDVPRKELVRETMQIDAATRRSLELTHTLSGARKGSVLWAIDRTVSAAGARALLAALSAPLTSLHAINARLDAVSCLQAAQGLRAQWREVLKQTGDMERAVTRIIMQRSGPRDLVLIRETLRACAELCTIYHRQAASALAPLPALLHDALAHCSGLESLMELLSRALKSEVPLLARDGGFVADGYRADLDEWRSLTSESKRVIAAMEMRLRAEADISSLKIKFNNVLGYFIEITAIHEKKIPASFIHRQTMSGALRYTTAELAELAQKMEQAESRALRCEQEVYEELCSHITSQANALIAAARALAQIDMFAALAELASEQKLIRPELYEDTRFEVRGGRHIVVEAWLAREGARFMANDCCMGQEESIWLITGPNMAGKSTFLRQNALMALLSHIGCFVPADSAQIGIVDALFSRVGAADDLARGQSTFMVEMLETAAILHQATARSLVILDEIGRGTATYDGLSIAWAVVEHLHNITQCRALFATHYHELTVLETTLAHVVCYHSRVKEHADSIVFLHQIAKGSANRSYGVHVAQLAGLPKSVTQRAAQLLHALESSPKIPVDPVQTELPLFASAQPAAAHEKPASDAPDMLRENLAKIEPDSLSPREALEVIYRLKALG